MSRRPESFEDSLTFGDVAVLVTAFLLVAGAGFLVGVAFAAGWQVVS